MSGNHATFSYDGAGNTLTTFIWDGSDYLMEKN